MKLNKSKKGFTIVELVIVIGVIGILSAILIPTFVNLSDKAKTAAMKEECAQAYSAYVAEAADGIVDESGDDILFLKQSEVVLVKGEGKYEYTEADGWKERTEAFTPTAEKLVVASNTSESTYNTYLIYDAR